MGNEQIVYGDKVINVINHGRKDFYPKDEGCPGYIANGEVGVVVGQFKTKKMKKAPWQLKVMFSTQLGYRYDFRNRDFGEEMSPPLELAYALTVHKAQGSEFGTVFLVLPNPCRLLSRELLYTALTRQRDRLVVLYQGNRGDLKAYAEDTYSETAKRITNLFDQPKLVEYKGSFYEDSLIHMTERGDMVRSKSEVIIADKLYRAGIDYQYEHELELSGEKRYPDFTFEDDEMGITYYWEHCGMLHDPAYLRRWERKLEWYRANEILMLDEGGGENGTLVVTLDDEQGGISSKELKELIDGIKTEE